MRQESSAPRLEAILLEMTQPQPDCEYYAFSLLATAEGSLGWTAQTSFCGYEEGPPLRELRSPCFVHASILLDLWKRIGTPGVCVSNTTHLAVFLHLGGNALIERGIASKHFPELLKPFVVVPTGAVGYIHIQSVAPEVLKRAPSPKLRMRVLKRDGYRCRICGRRPDDNTDIELHTHHFRPWALGGLTAENNLLTVCHTCHKGLEPHYEHNLLNIFPEAFEPFNNRIATLSKEQDEYRKGVVEYRAAVRMIRNRTAADEKAKSKRRKPAK